MKINYRYEISDFEKKPSGEYGYSTREKGEIPYFPETLREVIDLKLRVWKMARELAEKTGKRIAVCVRGNSLDSVAIETKTF